MASSTDSLGVESKHDIIDSFLTNLWVAGEQFIAGRELNVMWENHPSVPAGFSIAVIGDKN
ncbi:MAG: hypothetical protein AAF141_10815 [Pseudomonadota bacterium]